MNSYPAQVQKKLTSLMFFEELYLKIPIHNTKQILWMFLLILWESLPIFTIQALTI